MFNPKIVIAMITAGLVAFALFMVLMAYAGDLRGGRDGRAHALSGSAVGFKGLVRLITLGGGDGELARSEESLDTENLVVAAVEPATSHDALEAFIKARANRPTLIILPKWQVVPDATHPGWVKSAGFMPDFVLSRILDEDGRYKVRQTKGTPIARGQGFMPGFQAPAPAMVQVIEGDDLTPLVTAGTGATLLAKIGDSPLYVLAEPDLLNNQAMRDPVRAKAALTLLDELNATDADGVVFDLTLNGFARQPSALKLAFERPFLPLTLALAVAALLAGLHGAFRFGPAARDQRAVAFGKSALVENSAALLRLARREHRTGEAYAELIREAAAHDSGAHLALRDAELDAYLDRLSPADRPKFTALVEDARTAEDRPRLIAAARALFQWKKDLIT
ncbi:hypothetical protein [Sphingosinicella sp. BN140058]|uniref:hypothetical protein n=1 Tax=Sphingosinicella sp. BN140058 TaxID=1892855 RepID=UPI001012F54A|nr:hypothetical protein [Sphingosinicella sp. BN140058]QAY78585.1 hypothetical protein ETR14_20105 [Sphingosinicella sp. BN140058]